MTVMQPKKVKDVREMQAAVEEWDVKVSVPRCCRLTVPVAGRQGGVQGHEGQGRGPGDEQSLAWAADSRGGGQGEEWYDEQKQEDIWDHECYESETGVEVDHLGESCRRCVSNGGNGKGRGKGNADEYHIKGKGMGWQPKKGGKGFGGECWTCGGKGLRATERPSAKQVAEIGSVEEAAAETNVGGF